MKSAVQGNVMAQFILGQIHYFGFGVEIDYETAVDWFSKASHQDDVDSQYFFGMCYEYGRGVEQNYEQAVVWFTKAAELGSKNAQYYLGKCYAEGLIGVTQDYGQAVKWYTEAAEQGDADAQRDLGILHYQGLGVIQDYIKAVIWLTKSACQDDGLAQFILGSCYYEGKGLEQDDRQAVVWLTKAADKGLDFAQNLLRKCLFYGHGLEQYIKQANVEIGDKERHCNSANMNINAYLKIMKQYAHIDVKHYMPEKMLTDAYSISSSYESTKSLEESITEKQRFFELITSDGYFEEYFSRNYLNPFLSYLPIDVQNKLIDVPFVVLITDEIRAYSGKAPNGGAFVIINKRLMKAIWYYVQALTIAGATVEGSSSYFIPDNELPQITLESIAKDIVNYFDDNTAMMLPMLTPFFSYKGIQACQWMCTAMELFVILHEYAHIYLGHLDIPCELETADNVIQQRELDADLLAFKWLRYVKNVCDDNIELWNALLWSSLSTEIFLLLGFYELARMFRNEVSLDDSHPLIADRLRNIINKGGDFLPNDEMDDVKRTFNTLAHYIKKMIEDNKMPWD